MPRYPGTGCKCIEINNLQNTDRVADKALHLYRFVLGNKALHDGPGNEVGKAAEAEHDEVAGGFALEAKEGEGCALGLGVGKELTGNPLDNHGADTSGHCADTGNGGDGALGEHVTHGGEEVGAPGLMSRTCKADEDGRPPGRVETHAQRLRKQRGNGEERKDEHGQHSAAVRMHTLLLNKKLGQISSADGNHRDYEIQRENEPLAKRGRCRSMELVAEIRRRPEQEEPPYAVGKELAGDEAPGLLEGKAFEEADGFRFFAALRMTISVLRRPLLAK